MDTSIVSKDLISLAGEFEAWRRKRPYARSRVPDHLVAKAAAAAKKHSEVAVASAAQIGVLTLRRGLDRNETKSVSVAEVPIGPVI